MAKKTITAVDGKAFKLSEGKHEYVTGGTGDITLAKTLEGGSSTSTITLTAPNDYIDETADCTIVPTLGTATLDIREIEVY